ncbi:MULTISPECIES: hypothetical protein [Streptomyces]|uniref:Uncharacterized protein n=1 Tax=Streptomyces sviceus (strain ATCC 29083 / DSM 924 / JCM 4929 / NBRC 13980 / NCIMB 11184 / NRRL 5439 / UC 5370) TaxID=463191 RepID=B5I4J3_STRX2|nr:MULTISPECIES: hypothetical protein [Streptomyces]EDY59998.2 conserved hypothetical protein [Streptomyces sviceus ATCC 29083]
MSRNTKAMVLTAAALVIVSTPLVWLLGNADVGQLVGAAVQAGTGVAALVWALFRSPSGDSGDSPRTGARNAAVATGRAEAEDGGTASTGVRRSADLAGGSARAERTGDAVARGTGSRANTGVDLGE